MRIIIVLFFCLQFFPLYSSGKKVDISDLELYRGTQKSFSMKYSRIFIEERIKKEPDNVEALLIQSLVEDISGNTQKAIEIVEKVKDKFQQNIDVDIDFEMYMKFSSTASDSSASLEQKERVFQLMRENLSEEQMRNLVESRTKEVIANIKNGDDAKREIEKTIENGEYEVSLNLLIKSYNNSYIGENYFNEKKIFLENIIAMKKKEAEEARRQKEEKEKINKEEKNVSKKEWSFLYGSEGSEYGNGVFVNTNGVFLTGHSYGEIDGEKNAGGSDAFIFAFDYSGKKIWTQLIGSYNNDSGIKVLGDKNNIYVVGYTSGNIGEEVCNGETDVFVASYSFKGNLNWVRIFGSKEDDLVKSFTIGKDALYITGYTLGNLGGNKNRGDADIFVAKYDLNGEKSYLKTYGSQGYDVGNSIVIYEDALFIAGVTDDILNGTINKGSGDGFLMKTDLDGNILFTEIIGEDGYDIANSLTVDRGKIFITGETSSNKLFDKKSNGKKDAFICSYDKDGKYRWGKIIGSSQNDTSLGIVASLGNLYITGYTGASLGNNTNNGGNDAFIMKYNFDGEPVFVKLLGSKNDDIGRDICVGVNLIYITGGTNGNFDGLMNKGNSDIFIKMISM